MIAAAVRGEISRGRQTVNYTLHRQPKAHDLNVINSVNELRYSFFFCFACLAPETAQSWLTSEHAKKKLERKNDIPAAGYIAQKTAAVKCKSISG